jgi:hypothetical protein
MKKEKEIYIFESPDEGKTVYRRKFGDYDCREKLVDNKWIKEEKWRK